MLYIYLISIPSRNIKKHQENVTFLGTRFKKTIFKKELEIQKFSAQNTPLVKFSNSHPSYLLLISMEYSILTIKHQKTQNMHFAALIKTLNVRRKY